MAEISGTGAVELPSGHVLDGLTIYGKCVQDGTPTPDAPVEIQRISSLALSTSNGQRVEIDLHGEELCSLPDGTEDVLEIGADGHAVLTKRTDALTVSGGIKYYGKYGFENAPLYYFDSTITFVRNPGSYLGNIICDRFAATETVNVANMPDERIRYQQSESTRRIYWRWDEMENVNAFNAWAAEHPISVIVKVRDARTVDLGYVELPDVRGASTLSVIAEVEPQIDVELQPYSVAGGGCFDERA